MKNARLAAVLARAGYATATAVAGAGDAQLLGIDGVSEKALRQIREKMPAVGLLPESSVGEGCKEGKGWLQRRRP